MLHHHHYRPQQSWGKFMFLNMSVILFMGGGGISACIAGGIPACLAAGFQGEGGSIPACLEGFQAHTQEGGSPGPHLEGVLRAHTWGVYPCMH